MWEHSEKQPDQPSLKLGEGEEPTGESPEVRCRRLSRYRTATN